MTPDAVKNVPESEETAGRGRLSTPLWLIGLVAVLVLIALVGLCQVTGLARKLGLGAAAVPTPTSTPLPTQTSTPTVALTPTPLSTVTPTPPPQVAVGIQVVVRDTDGAGLRVRSGPGLNQQVIVEVSDGVMLRVLEGPQSADGYTWWKVQTVDGQVGWAAANWLSPSTP